MKSNYRDYISDPSLGIPKATAWRHSRANQPYDVGRRRNRSEDSPPSSPTSGQLIADPAENGADTFRGLARYLTESSGTGSVIDDSNDLSLDDPALQPHQDSENMYGENGGDEPDFDVSEQEDDNEKDGQSSPQTDGSRPIYEGAPISVAVSLLMIITYAMAYHLTGEGTADLLILIELHCVSPNLCSKTLKMFTDYFRTLRAPLEFHHYCYECHHYYGKTKISTCPGCQRHSQPKDPPSYFIVLPIVDQIRSLFGGSSLMQDINQYKKYYSSRKDDNIQDILDGQLYKERFSNGFFKDENANSSELHISLQMNTDGVSLFHSSSFSIWPVYFVINELPPHLRFNRNNRIFGGLWFGYTKPDFKVFLKPFAEMLCNFYTKGTIVDGIRVRGILLDCVFDAPARCLFHNMVQFNGFYGCPYCLSPGESVKTSERGHTHSYPFETTETGHGPARTHPMFLEQGNEAERRKLQGKAGNVFGIKGLTWFSFLPKFDMVRCVGIDYMHCVCLGVVKMLMSLWFDKAYRNETFNIAGKLHQVNEKLMSFRPPSYITRLPRSLLDIGHYKAAEYKTFMLYYSLPCLLGILPEDVFQHYLLLVQAMFILLSDKITPQGLKTAQNMIMHFCINVSTIYGPRYMTSNVHLLLHLTEKVKDLGPLWATSCFYFEDFNGQLRTLFHGTQKIESQIVFAVSVHQNLHKLSSCIHYGSSEDDFYKKMTEKRAFTIREKINSEVFVISAITSGFLTEIEQHAVILKIGGPYQNLSSFKRVKINNNIVHSRNYKCVVKRNNTVVRYGGGDFGHIVKFVKLYKQCQNTVVCKNCGCKNPIYLAILDTVSKLPIQLSTDRVSKANVCNVIPVSHPSGILRAIHVQDIDAVCVWMPVTNDLCFVSVNVNKVEKE